MYNLHAVTNPGTFAEVLSNICGLAILVLIAPPPLLTATCLDNAVICSWSCLMMAG